MSHDCPKTPHADWSILTMERSTLDLISIAITTQHRRAGYENGTVFGWLSSLRSFCCRSFVCFVDRRPLLQTQRPKVELLVRMPPRPKDMSLLQCRNSEVNSSIPAALRPLDKL